MEYGIGSVETHTEGFQTVSGMALTICRRPGVGFVGKMLANTRSSCGLDARFCIGWFWVQASILSDSASLEGRRRNDQ